MADGSIGLIAMRNRDHQRLRDADQELSNALRALTRATCLLGASEGKVTVQVAHQLVNDTQRYIQMRNEL